MTKPKTVFVTAIEHLGKPPIGPDIYRTVVCTSNGNHELFKGTKEECERYNANLHHSIDPNIVEKFDPRKDVRRRM